jgi:hypothetical protein
VAGVAELARHRHVGPVEAGGADRLADAALVAVYLRRVDVAAADLERRRHRLRGDGGIDLEDAEAELRDDAAVVEGDRRRGDQDEWATVAGVGATGGRSGARRARAGRRTTRRRSSSIGSPARAPVSERRMVV